MGGAHWALFECMAAQLAKHKCQYYAAQLLKITHPETLPCTEPAGLHQPESNAVQPTRYTHSCYIHPTPWPYPCLNHPGTCQKP